MQIATLISNIERSVIIVIIALTVLAVFLEIAAIWEQRNVAIADILLLFLYTEVLSMAGAFYHSRRIPTIYPLLIAITALSRLIVLQSKEMEPSAILYEASAIAILTIAVAVLFRFGGEGREVLSTDQSGVEGKGYDNAE
ncbi:MAG: phosphate-starvation-inducible PsiE family protein [Pseudomonadota bacterium]